MAYSPNPNTQGPAYRYSPTFNKTGWKTGDPPPPAPQQTTAFDSSTGNYDPQGSGPGFKSSGGNLGYGSGAPNNAPGNTGTSGPLGYIAAAMQGEHGFNANAPVVRTGDFETQRTAQAGVGGEQAAFNQELIAAARGQGPSAAQAQLKAGRDAAVAAAASRAAGATGANIALANRAATVAQNQAVQSTGREAAILRATEQQNAMQLASNALNERRLAELQNQGMSLDMAKAQLQAETQALGYQTQIAEGTAERRQGGIGTLFGAVGGALGSLSDIRAKEQIEADNFGAALRTATAPAAPTAPAVQPAPATAVDTSKPLEFDESNNLQKGMAQGAGIGGMLGGILSDARSKEYIRKLETLAGHSGYTPDDLDSLKKLKTKEPGDAELEAIMQSAVRANSPVPGSMTVPKMFTEGRSVAAYPDLKPPDIEALDRAASRQNLDPVNRYKFQYKPEVAASMGTDTAPRVGVMAQDLLKSPSYQEAVIQRPDGMLALDRDRMLSANAAEIGGIDKRLKRLEAR